ELERRVEQHEARLAEAAARLAEAERYLRALPPRLSKPASDARAFLTEVLATEPRPATEVIRLAGERGIAERTLRRAKAALGVASVRGAQEPGRRAVSWWRFPG